MWISDGEFCICLTCDKKLGKNVTPSQPVANKRTAERIPI